MVLSAYYIWVFLLYQNQNLLVEIQKISQIHVMHKAAPRSETVAGPDAKRNYDIYTSKPIPILPLRNGIRTRRVLESIHLLILLRSACQNERT